MLATAPGELSVYGIAKILRRTNESVKARVERLEMAVYTQPNYCIGDLSKILGAPRYRVDEWIEKGLLGSSTETPDGHVRVTDESLRNFILNNPALVDFRLADQTFIKSTLCERKSAFSRPDSGLDHSIENNL